MSNRDDSLGHWRMYDFCASYMGLHAAYGTPNAIWWPSHTMV